MTALGWFALVMGFLVLLAVMIGGLAGTQHQLALLTDAVERLERSHRTLSHRVDDARYATQVIPKRILDAHMRSLEDVMR